jgi:hypothetical protein
MSRRKTEQTYIKRQSISADGETYRDEAYLYYEPFKEGVGYNFKYRSAYVKSYLGVSLPYDQKGKNGFTDIELGRIYRISRLMYSNSNLLAKRSNNLIVPYTRDDIQLLLKMHRTKFVPFWKKITEKRLLKQLKYDGQEFYCMNPLYFNSMTYIPLHVYMAFQSDIQEHVPKWVIEKYLEMQPKPKEEKKKSEADI